MFWYQLEVYPVLCFLKKTENQNSANSYYRKVLINNNMKLYISKINFMRIAFWIYLVYIIFLTSRKSPATKWNRQTPLARLGKLEAGVYGSIQARNVRPGERWWRCWIPEYP